MKTLFLIAQAAVAGVVAGIAFPEYTWEFWTALAANSVMVVAYGAASVHSALTQIQG
jgi:hypothetical protein